MSKLEILFVDDNGSAHRVHVGHGGADLDPVVLQRLEIRLIHLQRTMDELMANVKTVEELIAQMNSATNNVANRLSSLVEQVQSLKAQTGAVTQEQLDSIAASLSSEVSRLTSLAADPANPVPAEPLPGENPAVPGTLG